MANKKLIAIFSACAMILAAGCTKEEKNNDSKYNELVEKYNKNVRDYNDMVRQNLASDKLLIETGKLVADLDNKAEEVRTQSRKVREGLSSYRDAATLKADMTKLDRLIQDALAIVGKLESQTSKKNVDRVVYNADLVIKDQYRSDYVQSAKLNGQAVGTLSGIRDLFLSQYNDMVDSVNKSLGVLPAGTTPAIVDPSREGNLVPDNVNPVVNNANDGGRVVGVARNSVSGSAVAGAFVGFKKRAESRDYFYETRTDAQGQYQSPYLLPGTYFVDIQRDGYINVQNQQVRVNRGQESKENLAMSEPLGEGVYRITMSWTSQKAGAVKDVDSYLLIPGLSTPLSFKNVGHNYSGAHLDRDDTDWIGPETITINRLFNGVYIYYVNNYDIRSDQAALGNSEVRIKLYKGSDLLQSFSVPPGRGLSYEVFRIVDGQVRVTGNYDNTLQMH